MTTALGIVLGVCAVELIALVWLGLRRRVRRIKAHPYTLTPAALQLLYLSDEHWVTVCEASDFEDFTPADFSDIEAVLMAARNTVGAYGSRLGQRMPGLDDICVWDSSDDNNWDFLVTVDVGPLIRVASTTIKIGPFSDLGCGPLAARAVLQELLDERNRLVSALATATGRPVIASSR